MLSVVHPLSSNRQHSEINDCLDDNREDYYNYHYCKLHMNTYNILGLAHFLCFVFP